MFSDLAATLSFAFAAAALIAGGLSMLRARPMVKFGRQTARLGYRSSAAVLVIVGIALFLNGLAIVTGTPHLGELSALCVVPAAGVLVINDLARRRG